MNQIDIDAIVKAIVSAADLGLEATVVADEVPVVEPSPEAQAKAKVGERAKRKAANQKLNRQINAQLANATKAFKAGDAEKCVAALKKAQAMTPEKWVSVHAQIQRKAESLLETA